MTAADDAFMTQECECGHKRMFHDLLVGRCWCAHHVQDRSQLPEPEYAEGASMFAWPANWPPNKDIPRLYFPCECRSFAEAPPIPGPDGT